MRNPDGFPNPRLETVLAERTEIHPEDRSGRWWLACGLVFAATLLATVPTVGDLGLTWDEPAYRFSQYPLGAVVGTAR